MSTDLPISRPSWLLVLALSAWAAVVYVAYAASYLS
jgi:hypothetical protein